jgi:hypothetical protein
MSPYTYLDEFKDLIDLSGYTDSIAVVLKFHRGLNSTIQDRITESGRIDWVIRTSMVGLRLPNA